MRPGESDEPRARWIEGVTGYAPQHDVMELASEVRLLRETIVKLRDQLDNLGALLTVAGDSLRPEWRKRRTERKS